MIDYQLFYYNKNSKFNQKMFQKEDILKSQKSISILGQTITLERIQELNILYRKTKPKSTIKIRSNTIHITDQMTKPIKQKRVQSIHDV
ncbi:unnamed protein product [Paramecium octaurelia]|uniref:Uncharacterized protein n=1 Tax=Paramecium octaurelia TaxID=43137 RepID=A0A8S1TKV6_PAROT|nr:unnamed protein product [Paramecium octaurelia]